jgi:uncharacterized protein YjcR
MLLIDDILFLPGRGIMGLFRKISDAVEEEFTDESKVKDELMQAQMMFETDQITEEEYNRREKRFMQRLEEIRKFKKSESEAISGKL